ncbi:MAG: hypothetical protein MMC33_010340 [Icmadophila ericetorum]|nr:hypothetical protein [Icmadophila ericetorum]
MPKPENRNPFEAVHGHRDRLPTSPQVPRALPQISPPFQRDFARPTRSILEVDSQDLLATVSPRVLWRRGPFLIHHILLSPVNRLDLNRVISGDAYLFLNGWRGDEKVYRELYGLHHSETGQVAKDGNIIGLIKRHANAVSEYRAGKRLPESNLGKMEVAFQAFISAIHTGGFRTNFLND